MYTFASALIMIIYYLINGKCIRLSTSNNIVYKLIFIDVNIYEV